MGGGGGVNTKYMCWYYKKGIIVIELKILQNQ